MARSRLILRLLFTIVVLGLFLFTSHHLYKKQQLRLNFLSFQLENADHSLIIPDLDRFVDKLYTVADLKMSNWPQSLSNAVNLALDRKNFTYNQDLTKECFLSFNATDFVIVFNTTTSLSILADVISTEFMVDVVVDGEQIIVNGVELNSDHYGSFLAISTQKIAPMEQFTGLYYGNSDYVSFTGKSDKGLRHILSEKYHFCLWGDETTPLQGRAVTHIPYFFSAPADFDELVFHGSSQITEDVEALFKDSDAESFAWLNEGLLYVKKESFELLIAQQGENRDLNLMLEEQTLASQSDTAQLAFFNIGKYKVLPFSSTFNWVSSITELKSSLKYYTEYKNFNILANSIPAIRWYIRQVQLGKLLEDNQLVSRAYFDCLPQRSHYARMEKQASGGYLCQSRIYDRDSICLYSEVTFGGQQLHMEGVEIQYDFPIDIVPTKLTAVSDDYLLVNNLSQLSLYEVNGEKKWALTLSSELVEPPQLVDFENDGSYEYVLFQADQIDVINARGKSLNGFPIGLNGISSTGLAINYDNLYRYRLLVNVDNTVRVYNETGKLVEGWMFEGMNAGMNGRIYHVITQGKDIIAFKDKTDVQYVLNRRGEARLNDQIIFKLPNETDFVIGSLKSSLRKMGYKDGYIYNYYILDGEKDSVSIDQRVTPIKTYWEFNGGKPLLIIEEPARLLIVNEFGYVMSEVLKPNQSNQFVGLVGNQDYGFIFGDNTQNTIYLLNNYGKMILPQGVDGSAISIIHGNLLYTFSGIRIKAYKIAD